MDTKELRIKYNNEWPEIFYFPKEQEFIDSLSAKNLDQAIKPCNLNQSNDAEFQNYLSYLIDSLDMLPKRPDLAFDNLWKALDYEFFVLKKEKGTDNCSRFDLFVDFVLNDTDASLQYLSYLTIIPHQTSKYAAKRIIEASLKNDKHDVNLFSGAKKYLGNNFIEKFVNKFPPSSNGKPSPHDLRNAGRLLKLVFSRQEVDICGEKFSFSQDVLIKFLIKVVLANSRNERFHGKVFSPFRSSRASISTYSHAYYMLHISYSFLLDVFLYRKYGVVSTEDVVFTMEENIKRFTLIFGNLD